MSTRDSQRSKVYRAERVARAIHPGGKFERGDFESVQQYVDKLIGSAWWRRRYPRITKIMVMRNTGGTNAYGGAGFNSTTVKLPTGATANWAWNELVVLHEVAHCIVTRRDEGWHGRTFCRTLLELVRHQCGDEVWTTLRDQYRFAGVKWHRTRSLTDEQRQAAADRLRQYREGRAA